jgi:hypothetical protein
MGAPLATSGPQLTPREALLVEAIAHRVVEVLGTPPARHGLVDAATVAAALGVSRHCVYAHADELGGQRIGDGPRGRLRFDLVTALEGWMHRSSRRGSALPEIRNPDRESTVAAPDDLTSCVASRRSPGANQPVPAGNSAPRGRSRTGTKAPLLPIKGSGPVTKNDTAL